MITKMTLLICLFYISVASTYAQTGFSIGAGGAYLISYRTLKSDGSSSGNTLKSLRNDMETPIPGHAFSADILYQFNNNLTLSSALAYSNTGYQMNDLDLTDIFGNNAGKVNIRYHRSRLSIPIMVGYRLNLSADNKHSILFRLGLNNNLIYTSRAIAYFTFSDGSKKRESEKYDYSGNAYNVSACVNIGYYYTFGRNQIGVNALGDYAITPNTVKDSYTKSYDYFGGVGLSYLYSFSK